MPAVAAPERPAPLSPDRPQSSPPAPALATLDRRQSLLCLAAPLVGFAVVLLLFGVRYEVNDDAIISCIAAGVFGTDTVHLCYVNIVLGVLLKPFYLLVSGPNWYVLFSLAGVLAAMVVFCRLFMRRLGMASGLVAFSVFFLLAGLDALQAFQYTKNAALLSVAGVLLLGEALQDACTAQADSVGTFCPPVFSKRRLAWAAVFLVAGCCLRWSAFLAVAGLSAPVLILRLVRLLRNRRTRAQWHRDDARQLLRSAVLPLVALATVCLVCWGLNEAAYRLDAGWARWRQYNVARTEISDHRLQFLTPDDAADYGLSTADYSLLASWDYDDISIFSPDALTALAAALPHRTVPNALRELLLALPGWLFASAPGWLLCLAGLVLVLFGCPARGQLAAFLGILLVFLAELWLLFYGGRTPWRVQYLLLVPAALLVFSLCECRFSGDSTPVLRVSVALAAVAFLANFSTLSALWETQRLFRADNADSAPKFAALAELTQSDADSSLYIVSSALMDDLAGRSVWHTPAAGSFSHLTFLGGWAAQSPLFAAPLENAGLDPQTPLLDAVDANHVYVVDFASIQDKCDVLAEHLGLSVSAVPVRHYDYYTVYQLTTA